MCYYRCKKRQKCRSSQRAHNTTEIEDMVDSAKQQFVEWQGKRKEEIAQLNIQVVECLVMD